MKGAPTELSAAISLDDDDALLNKEDIPEDTSRVDHGPVSARVDVNTTAVKISERN